MKQAFEKKWMLLLHRIIVNLMYLGRPKAISRKKKKWPTLTATTLATLITRRTHSSSSPHSLSTKKPRNHFCYYLRDGTHVVVVATVAIPQQLRSPTNPVGCRLRTISNMSAIYTVVPRFRVSNFVCFTATALIAQARPPLIK